MSFAIVIAFMAVLVVFAVVATLLPRPSRECPKCGRRVPLTAPRCRHCQYQFAPDGSLPRYMR
jgi:predicted amidophosphoribosyltransferase